MNRSLAAVAALVLLTVSGDSVQADDRSLAADIFQRAISKLKANYNIRKLEYGIKQNDPPGSAITGIITVHNPSPPWQEAFVLTFSNGTWRLDRHLIRDADNWVEVPDVDFASIVICDAFGISCLASNHSQFAEFDRFTASQEQLAKKLKDVHDAAALVPLLDEIAASAKRLANIVAAHRAEQVNENRAYRAAKAWGFNYGLAVNLIKRYPKDPTVAAAWERVQAASKLVME